MSLEMIPGNLTFYVLPSVTANESTCSNSSVLAITYFSSFITKLNQFMLLMYEYYIQHFYPIHKIKYKSTYVFQAS
jgi:hypothetical protein